MLSIFLHKPLRSLLYPLRHEDIILTYSQAYHVPPSLVCAVIRHESRFRRDAVSHAGAYGLMQLTKPTFQELCARLGMDSHSDIFSPYSNIQCGVYYLRFLYDKYGNWETVLAAYNAGLGHVDQWLANPRYSADGKTLYCIPYQETAVYVQDVIKTKEIYHTFYFFGS